MLNLIKTESLIKILLAASLYIYQGTNLLTAQEKNLSYYISQAPFSMPEVVVPEFKAYTFSIVSYGAMGDGQTLNTEAFSKAINACTQAGGGKVIVPPGLWLTGPIQLKNNVNLHVERGATILFTSDHTQYPMIKASAHSSKFVPASPIYGYELKNIAITGEGVIDGAGESWRPIKKMKMTERQWNDLLKSGGVVSDDGKIWWPTKEALQGDDYLKNMKKTTSKPTAENFLPARDYLRPYMVYLVGCENILIEKVTLRNSPKFVFYPNNCKNLTIRYANIYNDWWAQNGDGIDISACKHVVIYKCNVNVGDDGICMKSSRRGGDKPGTFNLENVIIAGCNVFHGHGGFVIGSNTDGGMRNIFVNDCNFLGTDIGIRVKSNTGRGGLVKNIYVKDIYMTAIQDAAISFSTFYKDRPAGAKADTSKEQKLRDKIPEFQDFYINNVFCHGAHTAVSITGTSESPINNIFLDNVVISSKYGTLASEAENLSFNKVRILSSHDPVYTFKNARNITINEGFMPPSANVFLKAEGANTSAITISKTALPKSSDIIEFTDKAPQNAVIIKQ